MHYYRHERSGSPDKQNWFNRIKDMVDRYHPDLLYSDSPLPYPEEVGRQLLAHYYNDNVWRIMAANWKPSTTASKSRKAGGCRTWNAA